MMVINVGDCVMLPEKVISKKQKKGDDRHELIHVAVVPRNSFSFFAAPTNKKAWETALTVK